MTREANPEKNQKIKESLLATKQKRESQICRVFKVKLQESRLTSSQQEALKMLFVEAKWLVNSIINWSETEGNKLWNFKPSDTVVHKDKDMNDIESPFIFLGSQIKQSIVADMISSIRTMATLKRRNKQTPGKLKYKREIGAVTLKQHGTTFKVINRNKIKIQKIPGKLHVNGLNQIGPGYEIANAKLLNTANGYYLAITCFIDRDKVQLPIYKGDEIGIDLGCSTTITLSNGEKFNVCIQETERLKKLQRKLAKQENRSKGRQRTLRLIKGEYQKMCNKKTHMANLIVHEVLSYRDVYMQDENISGWKEHHGKAVQRSVLGILKSKLKTKAKFVLDRYESTTKMCYNCGQIHDIPLSQRVYHCDCGIPSEDRDVHAAKNMIVISKIRLGLGPPEFTHVDTDDRSQWLKHEATTSLG